VAEQRSSEDMHDDRPLASVAEAKAMASEVRLRILRLCLDNALTNKEIARRLEANPATVLHHVRKLVETGFLAPQEERVGPRGSREIPYLATRKTWTLRLGEEFWTDMSVAMLEAFRKEVAQADPAQVNATRIGLRLNEEQYAAINERFKVLFNDLARMEPGPGAKPYSLFMAIHPDLGRD
jgi:DNA-binding CsgD family transcriptional regulator